MKSLKNISLQENDCLAIETAGATIKNEFPVENSYTVRLKVTW
jgi:hypothetical protein